MLASSGLRISELLNADIDKVKRMLIPQSHEDNTKSSWVSFYNEEAGAILKDEMPTITVSGLNHAFKKVSNKTGIHIYPHLLRAVFAQEMTCRQVPDRYIDAFCGRVPSSVLARHYPHFDYNILPPLERLHFSHRSRMLRSVLLPPFDTGMI